MTVHVYTTLGETCNFKLNNYEVIKTYTTDKDTATNFPILIKNVGDSEFGSNKLTIAQLKRAIPSLLVPISFLNYDTKIVVCFQITIQNSVFHSTYLIF